MYTHIVLFEEVMKEEQPYSALSCSICHKEAMISTGSEVNVRKVGLATIVLCKDCGDTIKVAINGPDTEDTAELRENIAILKTIHEGYSRIAKRQRPNDPFEMVSMMRRVMLWANLVEVLNNKFIGMAENLYKRFGGKDMPEPLGWGDHFFKR